MLSLIGTLLGLIPGLENFASTILTAHFDKQVKMYMAKTGVAQEVAVAAIQAQAQVATKWWFVAAIPPLWALPFMIYDAKIILWDKIIMDGTVKTDPLDPNMWYVHLAIVGGFFAHTVATSILGSKE